MNYENVFESIKLNLVPVSIQEESKNEISRLQLELQNAKNDFNKLKLECEEQKMTIDIIQAEKKSLEAEKKTSEIKFKEVSMKLKHKTHQYDCIMKKSSGDSLQIQKTATATQTIKEEPNEIGVVNVPASSSSKPNEPKAGTKRKYNNPPPSADDKKRKINPSSKIEFQSFTIKFTCEDCLHDWKNRIGNDFGGDPNHKDAQEPEIREFTSFELYREHVAFYHRSYNPSYSEYRLCESKGCLRENFHNAERSLSVVRDSYTDAPHGDIICELCGLSFKIKHHHDRHVKIEHFAYGKPYTAPFI